METIEWTNYYIWWPSFVRRKIVWKFNFQVWKNDYHSFIIIKWTQHTDQYNKCFAIVFFFIFCFSLLRKCPNIQLSAKLFRFFLQYYILAPSSSSSLSPLNDTINIIILNQGKIYHLTFVFVSFSIYEFPI